MSETPCYLIFGPQGSGKSTQAELLSEKLNLPYLDSGKELRQFVQTDNSDEGRIIAKVMQEGQLVPNTYLKKIIENFMSNHRCDKGIVIDGFPRNTVQVELFEKLVAAHDWKVVGFYVHITDQTAQERLAKRHQIIDGKKVVRSDDKPAIVAKRLAVFKQETMPVIDYLKNNYQLYEIDGEPSRDEVFQSIINHINE